MKGTKLYSIFKHKCPFCHEGEFFEGKYFNAVVKDHCDNCNQKYSKEPGFYQGSYYVTYALGVAVFVTLWVLLLLLAPNLSTGWTVGIIVSGIVLSSPFLYPMSKIVWANLFFKYKK